MENRNQRVQTETVDHRWRGGIHRMKPRTDAEKVAQLTQELAEKSSEAETYRMFWNDALQENSEHKVETHSLLAKCQMLNRYTDELLSENGMLHQRCDELEAELKKKQKNDDKIHREAEDSYLGSSSDDDSDDGGMNHVHRNYTGDI